MSELARMRERVEAAAARIQRAPATGPGVYGSPDPTTGERWNAGNVMGHLAEVLEFWPGQVRRVLGGATEAGRDEAALAQRMRAIAEGATMEEAELRARISGGCSELLELLGSMREEDLDRELTYHARTGDEEKTLRTFVEDLLIDHLEGHAAQLEGLSSEVQ